MAEVKVVEGIGEVYKRKLVEAGITTRDALPRAAASPRGCEVLAEKTGISRKRILEWANHIDLCRVKGVGEEYSDLLEEAGVDTIPELAQRNAENLYAAPVKTNSAKKLVRRLPSQNQVGDWVEQAKNLPRIITH